MSFFAPLVLGHGIHTSRHPSVLASCCRRHKPWRRTVAPRRTYRREENDSQQRGAYRKTPAGTLPLHLTHCLSCPRRRAFDSLMMLEAGVSKNDTPVKTSTMIEPSVILRFIQPSDLSDQLVHPTCPRADRGMSGSGHSESLTMLGSRVSCTVFFLEPKWQVRQFPGRVLRRVRQLPGRDSLMSSSRQVRQFPGRVLRG